jgi:hypothetical protein
VELVAKSNSNSLGNQPGIYLILAKQEKMSSNSLANQLRAHNTGSGRFFPPARKTGETERLNDTFFLGSVGPVETSENRSLLLPSRSGRSGFREYRPVANGILNLEPT